MKKHVIAQYTELLKEQKDIQRRLKHTELQLKRIETDGYQVADSVTYGKRGKKPLGTRVIRGFPYPEWEELHNRLEVQKAQLGRAEKSVTEGIKAAEDYIQGVSDSRIRRLLRFRYLDGLGWTEVAIRMGGKHTADSCRMAVERFLREK